MASHGVAGSGWLRYGPFASHKNTMKTAEKKLTAIGGESPTNGAESGIAMKMPYRVEVTIEGVCPILFHAW